MTNPGQSSGVFLNVTVTNPGQCPGVFLNVTATNPGHGTNFFWQEPCLNFTPSLAGVSKLFVTSFHYMYMVSTSPSMLCYEPVQEHHKIGYRFWRDTQKDYNFQYRFIVVSWYTTSYQYIWCTKSFLVSNHHSFLPKDCAPGTQSTRWIAVTLLIWGIWWLILTLPWVVSTHVVSLSWCEPTPGSHLKVLTDAWIKLFAQIQSQSNQPTRLRPLGLGFPKTNSLLTEASIAFMFLLKLFSRKPLVLIGYERMTSYMEAGSCSHEAGSRGVFHLLMYTSLHRAIPELGPIKDHAFILLAPFKTRTPCFLSNDKW